MEQVRFGLIGMGEWARTVHIPNLIQIEGAHITALCSRSPENLKAGEGAARTGNGRNAPRLYSDLTELLNDPAVDAVIVCTPNGTHEAITVEALQAGKHVLCEKPLSFTLDGCRRVHEAVGEARRAFQIGLETRYSDVVQKLSTLLASGVIGVPRMAQCTIWRDWGAPQGWRSGHDSSGGIHLELSIHYLDLLDSLLGGGAGSLFCSGGKALGTEITDHFWTTLQYESGARASIGICIFAPAENLIPIEIVGDKGRIHADIITGKIEVWPRSGVVADESPPRPADYRFDGFPGSLESLKSFVHCVGSGATPLADIHAATRATRLALAAGVSEETGQVAAFEG